MVKMYPEIAAALRAAARAERDGDRARVGFSTSVAAGTVDGSVVGRLVSEGLVLVLIDAGSRKSMRLTALGRRAAESVAASLEASKALHPRRGRS